MRASSRCALQGRGEACAAEQVPAPACGSPPHLHRSSGNCWHKLSFSHGKLISNKPWTLSWRNFPYAVSTIKVYRGRQMSLYCNQELNIINFLKRFIIAHTQVPQIKLSYMPECLSKTLSCATAVCAQMVCTSSSSTSSILLASKLPG